jgi:hypothetical protein
MKTLIRLPQFANGLSSGDFHRPKWDKHAGESGAFVAASLDGSHEAIAEPLGTGWHFWLVRTIDGETIQHLALP